MNNATLGNSSLPITDHLGETPRKLINIVICTVLQLPINIYILQMIISKGLITSEFLPFNQAFSEILISFYNFLEFVQSDVFTIKAQWFFLGFVIICRPLLLMVICLDRYLAVVKPVIYLRLKPLRYRLVYCGVHWLITLASCLACGLLQLQFAYMLFVILMLCSCVKLYFCIATLCVLKQPGPGDKDRQRQGMNKVKLKAFRIMIIVTISVITSYLPLIVIIGMKPYLGNRIFRLAFNLCYTNTFFSGLFQSLHFLHRYRKLPCVK